jgi:quercetin dioxygenase-like cupin family protein
MKGAAMILLKTKSGCVIPWHWHTAREQLMIVSGTGTVQMKDEKPQRLLAATYVNLPGKHQHEFRCTTSCTLFVAIDGAWDIHYVDKAGNEIPTEQVLKTSSAGSQKTTKAGDKIDKKQ